MPKERLLIVGGGIAALSTAEAARKENPELDIALLSSQANLPIYRLRVAEVLKDPASAEKLFIHPQSWYDEKAIDVRLNAAVVSMDAAAKTVTLESGETLAYDRLVLAQGSRSFVPPLEGSDQADCFTLWTLNDAISFSNAIAEKKMHRIAIVGGGLLGLEASWELKQHGLEVVILERSEGLLTRQLDNRASELLQAYIEKQGLEVLTNADSASIQPTENSDYHYTLSLKDGRSVPCDGLLFAVGVRANTEFAQAAGLAIGRRVQVNEKMEASLPSVYAAGDVCEVLPDGYWFGLFSLSKEQGAVAGANAAGGNASFTKHIPPYQVMTMGTRIVSMGVHPSEAEEGMQFEIEENPETSTYRKLVRRGDQLVGFILLGEAAKEMTKLQKELA